MVDDAVTVLRNALSARRSVLMGALHGNQHLDIDRAFQIHAGLSRILTHWDEFIADQQREVISTIEYVVNTDDDVNDLTSPDGFLEDLERLHQLRSSLGYV